MWTSIHDSAFRALKQALSSAPVLVLPDFSVPFHVETDASGSGVGAILQQTVALLRSSASLSALATKAYQLMRRNIWQF